MSVVRTGYAPKQMAATPSLKIIKSFHFKAGTRTWSNRYHFNGGTPADATHWHTLMDAVTAAEKLCLPSTVTIIEAVGYGAGSDVPVATKTYSIAGTLTPVTNFQFQAGEAAALLRFATNARTTKNHPIYLFNYFHQALSGNSNTLNDLLDANQKSTMNTYGAAWISGFSDGSITAVRASPNGAAATGVATEEYITHRDFPHTPSL